ncbi:MAG TPA: ABC transporter substrate-binding protein [Chloroflexia bacterium]
MSKKRWGMLIPMIVMLSLLLAACGAEPTATTAPAAATDTPAAAAAATDTPAAAAPTNTTAAAAPTDTPAAAAATATEATAGTTPTTGGAPAKTDYSKVGPELVNAFAGQYKGTKVSMFGPFTGDDEVKFNNSMKDFEQATGIDIQYVGDKQFETTINVRVEGGSPPDIADFPQPGLLASIAKSGKVLDANKLVNPDWLKQNYNQGYLDTATVDTPSGKILGGIFQRVNAKGLVFYPKKAFDAAGYKTPTTWDEQTKLMNDIVADGDTPWCIGIASGTATGWPATDWVENIMLRTTSTENYDKWTRGELPFTAPEVKKAVQMMADIWFNDKYVYGGRQQIVSTDFGASVAPMFQDPPKCWLVNQGNFITSYFETAKPGVKGGVDYDFYYLPPIDPQYGKPVEFGGDIMTAFNDRPEVRAVLQYFSTFDGVKGWVQQGGAIAPQNDSDLAAYGSDMDRKVAQTLLGASVVRFDGSDLMPGAVGAGTFWKAMTDFVSGNANIDQALQEAQAGWASVKK